MGKPSPSPRWLVSEILIAAAVAVTIYPDQQPLGVLLVGAQTTPALPNAVPPGLPTLVPPGLPNALPPGFPPSLPPGLPSSVPSSLGTPNDSSEVSPQIMDQLSRLTGVITAVIEKQYSFCVSHTDADKLTMFGYSQSSDVLYQCVLDAGEDFVSRVCGQAEIELYFNSLTLVPVKTAGVPPNINCNANNYPTACEAGWAGTLLNPSSSSATNFSLKEVPARTLDPKSCCEGFFCPRGLTCMMPCPLGAYCPSAEFDIKRDSCGPYNYPSQPNLACGGADVWHDFKTSPGMFCEAGKYCPDTITRNNCSRGHYCRTGSTAETKCTFLTQCGTEGLKSVNVKSYGIMLVVVLFVVLLLIYNCSDQVMHIRERRKAKVRTVAAREARERVSAVERWKRAKEAAKLATKKAVNLPAEMGRSLSRSRSKISTSRLNSPTGAAKILAGGIGEGLYHEDQEVNTDSRVFGTGHHHRGGSLIGRITEEEQEGRREQELHLLRVDSVDDAENATSRVPWSHELHPAEGSRHFDLYESVHVPPVISGTSGEEEGLSRPSTDPSNVGASGMEPHEDRNRTLAHTRSQIYKYAYGQIEKEKYKQQSRPISLKELVESNEFGNMMRGKGRLQMEVSFVDLSLILKGSGKRILSHVTGKFSPCRVTAVMGPSGAGKTTFLNALAGKETGSEITGQVFINGQPGSIQSYKRVIGFVPQDDVVHGSLTVEENLVFSAKYRLPVHTPRQERVLVIERVIQTLGLMPIRDSLVGTVENRGISGGQRKRVNVGMELVMEPSMLILDEPTSGLDSTSSRLVVQSLKREATLGVNVCLVVHQPSYGLFQMFDDVMFLAKGGFTVYLGPVAEIEAYFSSLSFDVPDHTNPPDHYMDVLEGLILPGNDFSFDIKTLPVLWMCHNGYHIPRDLQESTEGSRKERADPLRIAEPSKSLFQEVWDELRVYILVRWDIFETSLYEARDLSGRRTPGFFKQFRLIVKRGTKQKLRESRLHAQDYIILLLAGICLGALANWKDESLGGGGYLYTIIAVGLLIMIASLRTFSADKLEFWRESSSGINRMAFFLAKDTLDHFNTVVKPLVYLSMFYFFNDPRSSFASNYVITLVLVYCCTGIAYIPAIVLNPQPAQLVSVFVPVIATLLVTNPHSGSLETITKLSYASWALQAYTIANAERYTGVWLITRCEALLISHYRLDNYYKCIGILVGYGLGARVVAYLCLLLFHRKRQK